jgi:predicted nucleic acid-binding protein
VLYLLSGDEELAHLLFNKKLHVSFVTTLELLSYQNITTQEQEKITHFLNDCITTDINASIKEEVIRIKKSSKMICRTALFWPLQSI